MPVPDASPSTLISILEAAQKGAVVLAVLTYLFNRRAARLLSERTRREKATSIIFEYTKTLNSRSSAARKLALVLRPDQMKLVDEGSAFTTTTPEQSGLLISAIPEKITEDQRTPGGGLKVTQQQSFLLRWEIVSQLNACEAVAQFWFTEVAHQETIEIELGFLLESKDKKSILDTFRPVAGEEDFPALALLMVHLEKRRGKPVKLTKPKRSLLHRIIFESFFGK